MCLLINSDSNIYQVNKDNDSSIPNQIYSCVDGICTRKQDSNSLWGKGWLTSGWNFWANYNDLTATSLGIMVNKGNHPQMALIQVCELL